MVHVYTNGSLQGGAKQKHTVGRSSQYEEVPETTSRGHDGLWTRSSQRDSLTKGQDKLRSCRLVPFTQRHLELRRTQFCLWASCRKH